MESGESLRSSDAAAAVTTLKTDAEGKVARKAEVVLDRQIARVAHHGEHTARGRIHRDKRPVVRAVRCEQLSIVVLEAPDQTQYCTTA